MESLPEFAFTEAGYAPESQWIVRRDQWKLIHVRTPADQKLMKGMPFELYDVVNDPRESDNLIASEPEIAEELKHELLARIGSANPRVLPAEPDPDPIDEDTEAALRALGYVE